ncbi:type I-C CRISPR-associated protein Cas5c [Endozoicomonas euniceicola]|uniref:Type I-C CRISPR-associated protein Cas5c n=1 Tax=Endozoicomonas euniceicola TaxID=1234143 RepID=A0ABY6GRS7_9GAMM|nr:type I-C CRISPR-associated protein Cas5c [Endozoicomonas euniceicola]UYM15457.1 type I-C CRISPR-associated protein Cas5c [Endozoicomonas euniceicola]
MPDNKLFHKPLKIRVRGEFACFTRPELSVERCSYPFITPSAARGILETVYHHKDFRWSIFQISLLKPISWYNCSTSEVSQWIRPNLIKTAIESHSSLCTDTSKMRQIRHNRILFDVDYVITAYMAIKPSHVRRFNARLDEHIKEFRERVSLGDCIRQPTFGQSDYIAFFETVNPAIRPIHENADFGYVLHDFQLIKHKRIPIFFHAVMKDGKIKVPPYPGLES